MRVTGNFVSPPQTPSIPAPPEPVFQDRDYDFATNVYTDAISAELSKYQRNPRKVEKITAEMKSSPFNNDVLGPLIYQRCVKMKELGLSDDADILMNVLYAYPKHHSITRIIEAEVARVKERLSVQTVEGPIYVLLCKSTPGPTDYLDSMTWALIDDGVTQDADSGEVAVIFILFPAYKKDGTPRGSLKMMDVFRLINLNSADPHINGLCHTPCSLARTPTNSCGCGPLSGLVAFPNSQVAKVTGKGLKFPKIGDIILL